MINKNSFFKKRQQNKFNKSKIIKKNLLNLILNNIKFIGENS